MAIGLSKGVALVQVLFIAAILSLMALHFTLTSRQQVEIATQLQDKVTAELLLTTWTNEVLYALLTQPASGVGVEYAASNKIAKLWNFHGKTFSPAENVYVQIQDLYGLLSLSSAGAEREFKSMLALVQVPENDSKRIMAALAELQGFESEVYPSRGKFAERKMFLQSISEMKLIPGLSTEQFSELKAAVTSLPNSTFNPLTAPDLRLKALLPAEVAQQLISLRESGQLTAAKYMDLTGLDDYEVLSFVPGQRFIINVSVASGAAVAKRRFICYIRPENQFPLIWLD